ncbi:hypothetical protein MBLNU230_g6240t1 [Neophaeotheca triangularis]
MDGYGDYTTTASRPTFPRASIRDHDEYRQSTDGYRERRRSPAGRRPVDTRDRRRSRSPDRIDRYQPDRVPRDEYQDSRDRNDYRRERRRSSPQPPGGTIDRYVPGDGAAPPPLLANPIMDPLKMEFQVGFTYFAEWWRHEQRVKEEKERQKNNRPLPRAKNERELKEEREAERPQIQAAYDKYKETLQKTQAQTFVRAHKNEDWFRERYVDEVREPFRANLNEYRQGLYAQFDADVDSGLFDDFTLEGIYKSESNGLGGVLEKEEGETTAAAEVLGVGDLLPSRGGDIRDPAAQQPTLLIKTVAPTVTREKFQNFAKEHLGEGEGGYQHLSLSDPNPLKRCHRIGWIILNPESEDTIIQQEVEDENGEMDEGKEEGETNGKDKPSAPLTTSDKALGKINSKTIEDTERGNFTVHCGVHRPPDAPRKKALWDLFSAPERVERDLELAQRLIQKMDEDSGFEGLTKINDRVADLAARGYLQPVIPPKPQRDPEEMDDREEGEEEEGMIEEEDETDDEELIIKKKKLDLMVEYLRRVYNFCFFCVFESDSVHELQRKCPGGHLRRPRASLTSAAKETARASAQGEPFPLKRKPDGNREAEDGEVEMGSPVEEKKFARPGGRNAQQLQRAYNWVKTYEDKILQILEPENVNIKKIGGIPLEEGLSDELSKYLKQEDINKYRCKVPECTKLFKAEEFWRKHVEKRHPEWYAKIRDDVELVNTYVLDPAHIAPSRSDANSNGHFPLSNHGGAPMGTPRGFNLAHHQMPMGFPNMSGNPMTPMGFVPAGVPMGWGPPGSATNPLPGQPGAGGVGPMRSNNRGGNGYRMPGPYARPDGRGRLPSTSGNGRPTMSLSTGFGGLDGGGAQAMGPREAVQGRTMRSYEDLDADKGDSTTALDY